MRRDDPLASPTLAQLYVTQGHYARAAKVLDAVLDDDPLNGHALALRERLLRRRQARVELALVRGALQARGALQVRYELVPETASAARPAAVHVRFHIIVAAWTLAGGHPRPLPVRSQLCESVRGSVELTAPRGPASACACLATLDAGGALRVLAVAPALTW